MAELESMEQRPSQFNPAEEIPERSWVYRLVKKHFFNDFGAYTQPVGIDEVLARPMPARTDDGRELVQLK
jgi:hypothetical protein